jgi:hypothetical protein
MTAQAATADEQRAAIRRTVGWILVGALCVAALTAIVAIVSGDFDDDDWRVIATSFAFGIYSALGAAGATLRLRASENLRTLGLATMLLCATGFVLLMPALWIDEDHEELWRFWGFATLGAFACSHASLMAGGFRDGDGPAVRYLGIASIALASLDSGIGMLAIAEAFDDVDEGFAQLVGVLVVLMVLTTALTPIVRRLQRAEPRVDARAAGVAPRASERAAAPRASEGAIPPPAGERAAAPPPAPLAAEVIAAADRIEALNADPGNRAPEIRREVQRLRELARTYSR